METGKMVFESLRALAGRIEKEAMSPIDLAEAHLERIDRLNGVLHHYITVDPQRARYAAQKADAEIRRGRYRGTVHGIPYTVKDLFMTRDLRTTGGSRVLESWVPQTNADAVEALDAAGAVLLGKANLHEFAYGATGENPYYGTVPNPLDTTRLAGGSSSGSAAAVATGTAVFALGTDTGGSVRVPAALCGIVGFKPTYGRISTRGVIPYCWSLDHVGILARSAADAAIVLHQLDGPKHKGPLSDPVAAREADTAIGKGVKGLVMGVPQQFFYEHLDEQIAIHARRALECWERLGARIAAVDVPSMELARTVSLLLQLPEMLSYHSRNLPEKAQLYGEDIRAGMALGQFLLAEHYVRARRFAQLYRRQVDALFEQVDLLITPSCPIVAPPLGSTAIVVDGLQEAVGNAITRFTTVFNITGHPAMSVPCGIHPGGLPMGIQIVGRHYEEEIVLRAACALERGFEGVASVHEHLVVNALKGNTTETTDSGPD